MGAAIIDFRVCPPLVKCKKLMFSGFIDTLMYGFSSTGVTIYCYFGLKFNNTCCEVIFKRRYNDNDIMTVTVIFPIQNQHKKKGVIKLIFCMKLKSKYINYNIRFLKLLLYDLK